MKKRGVRDLPLSDPSSEAGPSVGHASDAKDSDPVELPNNAPSSGLQAHSEVAANSHSFPFIDPGSDCPDSGGTMCAPPDEEERSPPETRRNCTRKGQSTLLGLRSATRTSASPPSDGNSSGIEQEEREEQVTCTKHEVHRRRLRTMDEFGAFLSTMQAKRKLSKSAVSDILSALYENQSDLGRDLIAAKPTTFRTFRKRQLAKLTAVKMTVCVENAQGTYSYYEDCGALPVKQITDKKQDIVYILYYVSLLDIVKLHEDLHDATDVSQIIDFNVDGVPETKSGGVSFDVLSIQFNGCRTVYTVAILEPSKRGIKIDDDLILQPLLSKLEASNLSIRWFLGDAPKRCKIRGHLQHNATYSCPYCLAKHTSEGTTRFYGQDSLCAPERTLDFIEKCVSDIEQNPRRRGRDKEKHKGVARRSPMSAVPGFHIIDDIPADRMHLVDLGIVRRMINLSYKVKGHTEANVGYTQTPLGHLSDKYVTQKVVSECNRRTRPIDFSNFKAEEWRILYLAMPYLVFETCPQETRLAWVLFVYIMRATMLPDKYYEPLRESIPRLLKRWYREVCMCFGEDKCSYNFHVFYHLDRIRRLAPLTEISASKFEDNFAILKQCFHGGSCSTGKQALENSLICALSDHTCEKQVTLDSMHRTSKVDDTLVCTRGRKIFRLIEKNRNETFSARPVELESGLEYEGLDLNEVLCFHIRHESDVVTTVSKKDIVGKCIQVGDKLSVLTTNMLLE